MPCKIYKFGGKVIIKYFTGGPQPVQQLLTKVAIKLQQVCYLHLDVFISTQYTIFVYLKK